MHQRSPWPAVVELSGVGLHLKGQRVLRNVELSLKPGITAVVGRNGAGKTSLLRVIAGVLAPDQGVVRGGGSQLAADPQAMSRHRMKLGWLPQAPGFPPRMRVQEFVEYAAWLKKIPPRDCPSAVAAALDHADLVELGSKRLGRLSGGQQRRAAFAAAIVGAPTLLLLDEPTAGLDPVQRERLLGRVRGLQHGCAVLLATHLYEDLALAADRWCALDQGAIVGLGEIDRTSTSSLNNSIEQVRALLSARSQDDE